jgi:hypothetical protein
MLGILLTALITVIAAYLALLLFLGWAMNQPPDRLGRVMSLMPWWGYMLVPFEAMWQRIRAGGLRPGAPAPDFSLETFDKSARVTLSKFRAAKQPVVLVFGSYT